MGANIDRRRGDDLRILVVGAGIGGLGVARALAQRGIAVDVVEREQAWAHAGAGVYLPGNALRALRALGLESAVMERAAPIKYQSICDHRGRLLAQIELAPLWGEVGACVALHRADLHDILMSWRHGVPVRMGLPVQQLHQHGDIVTVGFADGSTGDYDLVIGADGVHSTVRDLALGQGGVRPLGQWAWRFVTRCPPEVTTWTAFLGHGVTFLAVPISRGRVYCFCDAPTDGLPNGRGESNPGYLAELLSDFAGPVPGILDSMGAQTAVHSGPIEEVALEGWSRGSVLLIGDAAHATSPNMAEGAAMALEDGLVFAECLSSERGVAPALTRFTARRSPRTQWVRAQTHRRDRTRGLPPILRDFVLRRWGRKIFYHNYSRLLDPA